MKNYFSLLFVTFFILQACTVKKQTIEDAGHTSVISQDSAYKKGIEHAVEEKLFQHYKDSIKTKK